MYPSSIDGNEEFLSLYLHMAKPDGDASLQNSGVVVEVSLSIKDKVTSNRNTKTGLSLGTCSYCNMIQMFRPIRLFML